MKVSIKRLRFPRFWHDSLIYRAKHRRVAQMLGRYDIFEGLIGKGSCEGREPKGASLAVHSVSKLKYRHSPGQEAETHATYLICFHGS
jgi:hypothetical protein